MNAPIIGIDYTPAYEQSGGIGRYARELIGALADQPPTYHYRLFVAGVGEKPLPPAPGSWFSFAPSRIAPKNFARLWHRARVPLPIEQWTGHLDLFHATDFVLPPVRRGVKTLLTVHDLSFVRVPKSAAPRLKAYLDAVVPRSCRRADHILAVSAATKNDLIDLYGLPESKISVLPNGVSPHFKRVTDPATLQAVRAKYKIGAGRYILAVGTVQPRKNYVRLMEALAGLTGPHADVKLVIVGGRGWLEGPIYATLADLKLADRVVFTGFADDADLPALYSAAVCSALPSLYEGFGIPVLESMACGTPALTANNSSLIEIAGEAGLLVDAYSVESIRAGLIALLEGDQSARVAAGYAQAARFTWAESARKLWETYRRLLG
jgi:glycosyltransferase involved in cell wall biosynthesis